MTLFRKQAGCGGYVLSTHLISDVSLFLFILSFDLLPRTT